MRFSCPSEKPCFTLAMHARICHARLLTKIIIHKSNLQHQSIDILCGSGISQFIVAYILQKGLSPFVSLHVFVGLAGPSVQFSRSAIWSREAVQNLARTFKAPPKNKARLPTEDMQGSLAVAGAMQIYSTTCTCDERNKPGNAGSVEVAADEALCVAWLSASAA